MHNPRRILPIVIVLVLAAAGAWYWFGLRDSSAAGGLQASGTVETTEVAVAPEMSGRVAEVLVDEGQSVAAGQALFTLDDELLRSQRQRAETALQTARDGLASGETGLQAAQSALEAARVNAQAADANAQAALVPLEQALKDLNDNAGVARAKAEQAVAAANRQVRETTYMLDNYTVPNDQQKLSAMDAIAMTKERLDKARAAFEPYKYEDSGNDTREDLKERLDQAQADYDAAVRRMEYETAVHQAQAALDRAMQNLAELQDGPDPDQVAELEARIAAARVAPQQAQAAVAQAEVGVVQAQARLDQARSQQAQAQAELDLMDVQIKKLTVYAPVDGVVVTRSIEPGEVVQAGSVALTLGQLDRMTITVYLPEDRYGAIRLGMKARVAVDSFPGKVFAAQVERIADQAEYTPRNVQTEDGRRTTVFAIELSVENPAGQLKPGMPADVTFEE